MHDVKVSDDVLDIVMILNAFETEKNDALKLAEEELTETYGANKALRDAVETLLESLDIDGTCQLCEVGFNFHSNDCAIHPVNNALDRIDY